MHENSSRTVAMKRSLREKFKQNVNFVRPLYRKVKFGNRVTPVRKVFLAVDVKQDKPCGNGIYVKRKIVKDKHVDYNVLDVIGESSANISHLPCTSDRKHQNYSRYKTVRNVNNVRHFRNAEFTDYDLSRLNYGKMENHKDFAEECNKSSQAKNNILLTEKVPLSWLRVYPAPQTRDETTLSVVFRCLVCQLSLAAFLVLWTVLWVFIIQHFEGPYETEVSLEFEKAQNQLVIDLATELRQITPLSPKWKHAIEKRLEDERRITIEAVGRGAQLQPGQFWDLSGTFLFNIYVMTALGFGAPVPHTVWGRTSALMYAALAVPVHIFLMVNASTCIVVHIEKHLKRCKAKLYDETPSSNGRNTLNNRDSLNRSKNSELLKKSKRRVCLRRRVARYLSFLLVGRCMPVATAVYYACGAIAFGVMRGRTSLEAAMFPLEFTTTGGLQHVEGIVRILYGLYVEGAMSLLACTLAALRSHGSSTVNYVAENYRLMAGHHQTS